MIVPASTSLAVVTFAIGPFTSPTVRWVDANTSGEDHKELVMASDPPLVTQAHVVFNDGDIAVQEDAHYDVVISDMLKNEPRPASGLIDRSVAVIYEWRPGVGYVKKG